MSIFRDIRQRLLPGFKQGDIAKGSGVSQALISHYESGRSTPTYQLLLRLRNYYRTVVPNWNDAMLFDPLSNDNSFPRPPQ